MADHSRDVAHNFEEKRTYRATSQLKNWSLNEDWNKNHVCTYCTNLRRSIPKNCRQSRIFGASLRFHAKNFLWELERFGLYRGAVPSFEFYVFDLGASWPSIRFRFWWRMKWFFFPKLNMSTHRDSLSSYKHNNHEQSSRNCRRRDSST